MEKMLLKLGFSEKEVKVYLAVLELGSDTVIKIGKHAGVNRGTTYDILESLIQKGLVSHFTKGKKRYFSAEDPSRIIHILEIQEEKLRKDQQEIQSQKKELENVLPELMSIFGKSEEKPKVRFYEGKNGIYQIYEELIKQKGVLYYGSTDGIFQNFPDFNEKITKKMIANSVKVRDLVYKSESALSIKKYYQEPTQQMRFLLDNLKFRTDNIIYANKVAMISYGSSLHAVVIESKEIVETQKQIFEVLWGISKK